MHFKLSVWISMFYNKFLGKIASSVELGRVTPLLSLCALPRLSRMSTKPLQSGFCYFSPCTEEESKTEMLNALPKIN